MTELALPRPDSAVTGREIGRARDPLRSASALPGAPEVEWYAAEAQWELGLLDRLVREGFAASRDVIYASNYGRARSSERFRISGLEAPFELRTTGTAVVDSEVDDVLTVWVDAPSSTPAGLTILPPRQAVRIDVITDEGASIPASVGVGTAETPPHLMRAPIHPVPMTQTDGMWTAPAEVIGRVVLHLREPETAPEIWAGESEEEAVSRDHLEQYLEVARREDGSWASVHELGLRYLVVDGADVVSVRVEARMPEWPPAGSFACSDPRLTDIWNASAHTLRLCSQGLIVDGIKRDRMPWMGDLSLGAHAAAYVSGDADIVRRGLIALSRNTSGYINGIVDYTLWWLICLRATAKELSMAGSDVRDSAHVETVLRRLSGEIGDDGVLRPRPGDDAFNKPVFIDWGVEVDLARDHSALQLLWWWALGCAVEILQDAENPAAAHWSDVRARLRSTLDRDAWMADRGAWREYLGGEQDATAYPDIFAVLSRYFGDDIPGSSASRLLGAPATRTPFVTAYSLQALAAAGHPGEAVARVRRLWGDMLDAGATTFWEEFHIAGTDRLEMYGRPYGKSLCHAWSAGPAYLLPQLVTGLRPLSDGWRTFTVRPELGDLDWASAVVPTASGEIGVLLTPEQVLVDIPEGSSLIQDDRSYPGPSRQVFPRR